MHTHTTATCRSVHKVSPAPGIPPGRTEGFFSLSILLPGLLRHSTSLGCAPWIRNSCCGIYQHCLCLTVTRHWHHVHTFFCGRFDCAEYLWATKGPRTSCQYLTICFQIFNNDFSENHLMKAAEFKAKHLELLDVVLAFFQVWWLNFTFRSFTPWKHC